MAAALSLVSAARSPSARKISPFASTRASAIHRPYTKLTFDTSSIRAKVGAWKDRRDRTYLRMLGVEVDLGGDGSSVPVVSGGPELLHFHPYLLQHLLHLAPLLRLGPHLLHYSPDHLLATAAAQQPHLFLHLQAVKRDICNSNQLDANKSAELLPEVLVLNRACCASTGEGWRRLRKPLTPP